MRVFVLVLASLVLTAVAVPVMRAVARAWNLGRANFKGVEVPTGFGLILVLVAVPVYVGMLLLPQGDSGTAVFLAAVLGFGAVGLADDLYGTREVGGFRGHLGLLRKGRLTTGLVKAAAGGALGLAVGAVVARYDPAATLVNGLLIALTANMLNLLDLRPGRAVSCFWLGVLAVAAARLGKLTVWLELTPVVVPAVWLTAQDRSARVMLGDVGSNVLGAVLGLLLAYELGLTPKLALVLLLIGLHVYAERYSISGMIEGNRVLRTVDRLLGER